MRCDQYEYNTHLSSSLASPQRLSPFQLTCHELAVEVVRMRCESQPDGSIRVDVEATGTIQI